ncbi:hypothetical protein ES705_35470 [subsurface metagenome]
MDFPLVPIVAILVIAALEVIALAAGVNGTTLAGAMAIIGGIGGWTGRGLLKRK